MTRPPFERIPAAPRQPSARARALIFRRQGVEIVLWILGLVYVLLLIPWLALWLLLASVLGGLLILLLLLPAVGLGLLALVELWRRRRVLAFTRGVPALGRIVARGQDSKVRIQRRHPYRIDWSFEVAGKSYRGSLSSLDPELLGELLEPHSPQTNPEVTVLYDPRRPHVNTLYIDE